MYIAIVKTENGRISKYLEFETLGKANEHVATYGGFIFYNKDNIPIQDILVISEFEVINSPKIISVEKEQVNEERDRRIQAGVPFEGHVFDYNQMGKDNIESRAILAKLAIMNGSKKGDYRWFDPDSDFTWITQSNEKILMDAYQVSELGNTAMKWTTDHVFAARNLKDMTPIPQDYKDDKYWPDTKNINIQ